METETGSDPLAELEVMKAVHGALMPLSEQARGRVLRWAIGALSVEVSVEPQTTVRKPNSKTDGDADNGSGGGDNASGGVSYTAFADLFGDAHPQTDADKALIGGYWLQVINGAEDFTSQSVNDHLKNTGEAVGNVTRAFDTLKAKKPQLVRQLLKSGKTQQARKKFKLTTAGIEAVKRMLAGEN